MKQVIIYVISAGLAISALHACGPDEEELQQQEQAEEQARLDSLERAWEAEMEELRQDSIQQARQDSIAETEAAAETDLQEEGRAELISYDQSGSFTVQVRSWRSEEKAEEHADMWKQRGFQHTYVEQYGDENIGDVWFRVRLGNVSTHGMARNLKNKVEREFNTESWISSR